MLILNEKEIRQLVPMDIPALQAVAEGFRKLSCGEATLPPIMRIDVPEHNGEVDVKSAYLHGLNAFAIKVAAGFFDNASLGLPTGSGMMLVVSAVTGFPQAVLLDNGYLTDVRTGLAGALAAQYLAPANPQRVGVIGSGMQSRYQIRALKLVREFSQLIVYGIDPLAVQAYAQDMQAELGLSVQIAASPEEVVRQSDFVVTTTPSHQPIVKAEWLHAGLHITCMGADSEHKQEIEALAFGKASRIACDSRAQCLRLGELHHALQTGVIDQQTPITELGEIVAGRLPGRQSPEEITICDLTGVGVQDTQIALLAYHRALSQGVGMKID
ncbi:ectoine utilization protein EutC [Ornatilinea apprima]|uniref:Ectoine utilization protein EutC n=1 Tax=Ornatilinea apprima TaxID=1134406 RepID=A0A0P6YF78_9CHLR|nr:cyclodeaminase [Ornatilinea apprima]KPL80816.1 ectoine utilization protein EutC [Ornatilinea apprima]